jgi:predicted nuclease with TOPRIM domain
VKENEESLKEAAALQAEHENLLNEVKTIAKQKESLTAALEESKGFIEENDRLQAVIDKLTNDLAASKAQIEAIQEVVTPDIVTPQPAE